MAYTYYLKNKITGEKYYGVRYANGCNPTELWVTYFSSSKRVAQRIREHGRDSFVFEVRRAGSAQVDGRGCSLHPSQRVRFRSLDISW